jgi:hypothetical protein
MANEQHVHLLQGSEEEIRLLADALTIAANSEGRFPDSVSWGMGRTDHDITLALRVRLPASCGPHGGPGAVRLALAALVMLGVELDAVGGIQ